MKDESLGLSLGLTLGLGLSLGLGLFCKIVEDFCLKSKV